MIDPKQFFGNFTKEVVRDTCEFAKRYALFIITANTMTNNGKERMFILLVDFKSVPFKLYVFPDIACAYCGNVLTRPKEELTCVLCGKKTSPDDESSAIVCKNGHHICKDCYYFEVLKPLYITLHNLIANTLKIKEAAEKHAESNGVPLDFAFRSAIYSFLREEVEGKDGWDVRYVSPNFIPISYTFLSKVWSEEELKEVDSDVSNQENKS